MTGVSNRIEGAKRCREKEYYKNGRSLEVKRRKKQKYMDKTPEEEEEGKNCNEKVKTKLNKVWMRKVQGRK